MGQWLDQLTSGPTITIVSGRTARGARALSSGVSKCFVYGFGEGIVGMGATEDDWGTAFTVAAASPSLSTTARDEYLQGWLSDLKVVENGSY